MTIGTSDGQTFNSKWDQFSSQLGWKELVENGPVIKNAGGSKDTTQQDKRTQDAPKGSGGPSISDPRGMIPHITSEAQRLGIDPHVAIGVAKSEGLSTFKSSIPGENSFGAFQLYTGGGLGNEFQRKTGLDPSDPKNEKEGITFALEHAAQHGWSAFHGAKNTGISQWAGIPGDHIDYDYSHHVPLAASAKIDREGNPIGVSIHSGAPHMDDDIYHRGVAEHEYTEAKMMKYYIKQGMDPYEAYTMAHEKFATPTETEFVKAERGEDFLENQYKPYWRQVAAMAREQAESEEETNLGPQDHTTLYDLNREFKMKNAKAMFPKQTQEAIDREYAKVYKHAGEVMQGAGDIDFSKMRRSTNIEDDTGKGSLQKHFEFFDRYKEYLDKDDQEVVRTMKSMANSPDAHTREVLDVWAARLFNKIFDKTPYGASGKLYSIPDPPLPRPRPK